MERGRERVVRRPAPLPPPAAPCRKGPVVNNWSNNELLLEPGAPDVHHS